MGSDLLFTDGVIVIDKPAGPTSHDVVAFVRRIVGRSSIGHRRSALKVGHTGTLDPLASGVLPIVLGKATRLAKFLSSSDKEYEADIELGRTTTTFDRAGETVSRPGARSVADLTQGMIDDAVAEYRGTYLQQPPLFSAKKVHGNRAYELARKNAPVRLQAVEVTAMALDLLEWRGNCLRVRLVCSAGYYVRSLAHALGDRLGTGGHLARLVRMRSGEFSMVHAIGLDVVDRRPAEAAARVIPLSELLPSLPAVRLTSEGASIAARGGFIGAPHISGASPRNTERVRLLHPDGRLVAIAEAGEGQALLHPSIVLE
jgi:tRNA pseudouridine55 synthase